MFYSVRPVVRFDPLRQNGQPVVRNVPTAVAERFRASVPVAEIASDFEPDGFVVEQGTAVRVHARAQRLSRDDRAAGRTDPVVRRTGARPPAAVLLTVPIAKHDRFLSDVGRTLGA